MMPPALIPSDEDEDYNSEEDEDFAPDDARIEADVESEESDDEGGIEGDAVKGKGKGKGKGGKRKRSGGGVDEIGEAEDLGFENSGDEAIIDKGLKKKRRKGKKGLDEDEDEGGEGGVVKTRSMRAAEKIERKPLATTDTSTIDVDAIFQSMVSGIPLPSPSQTTIPLSPSKSIPQSPTTARLQSLSLGPGERRSPSTTLSDGPDAMILIKRSYTFAGKLHTEQKLVPRNSAEAQLYLSTLPEPSKTKPKKNSEGETETPNEPTDEETLFIKPKRPLKLARRSIFEPVPLEPPPKRTDLFFGTNRKDTTGVKLVELGKGEGKKLNTVEKSAMDWAGFVDKEGIRDELVLAGKSKGAFKERKAFLERVEGRREGEDRRRRGLPEVV